MSLQQVYSPQPGKARNQNYEVGHIQLAEISHVIIHQDAFIHTCPKEYTQEWAYANVHLQPAFLKACWNNNTRKVRVNHSCGQKTSEYIIKFLELVQKVVFSPSMLPFEMVLHNKWLQKLMNPETDPGLQTQGEPPQIRFNFNGQKPKTTEKMAGLLFDKKGDIIRMVREVKLDEVGGIFKMDI